MTSFLSNLSLIGPEFALTVAALVLLVGGAMRGEGASKLVNWASIAVLVGAALWGLKSAGANPAEAFGGALILDSLALFAKTAILLSAAVVLMIGSGFLQIEKIIKYEYAILVLLATLGMMVMVSANDLLSLYVGLELQSLALYVLAAFNRSSLRASEAGLKYFVLGALSSGLLLYGMSMIYGFAGTTRFSGIAEAAHLDASMGLVIGVVFVLSGLAFKISAVPFHMWTPDVYQGAPTPVTAFFATAPKLAAIVLIARLLLGPFDAAMGQWQQVIVALSVLSMTVGFFGAIMQRNIKRLMAYSSIANMGYAIIALSVGNQRGLEALLFYMGLYLITTLGLFACILAMRQSEGMAENIDDLAGLSKTRPGLAISFSMLMFSIAGLPPLAGFFGKLLIFQAAIDGGLLWLALYGAVLSVVGAFYYLRIVKIIWFDEAAPAFVPPAFSLSLTAGAAAFFMLPGAYWLLPALERWSQAAAASLF
jgi:NADH-quinone oxidoreductase subunit N